jgi:hypothetical protein
MCFDCNLSGEETRLVQLDHDAIVCDGEILVVEETAPSFVELVKSSLNSEPGGHGERMSAGASVYFALASSRARASTASRPL